jgi:hypothetical protein
METTHFRVCTKEESEDLTIAGQSLRPHVQCCRSAVWYHGPLKLGRLPSPRLKRRASSIIL